MQKTMIFSYGLNTTNFSKKQGVEKNLSIVLQQQQHPFHIVDPSPWPLVIVIFALGLTTGTVMYMHSNRGGGFLTLLSLLFLLSIVAFWLKDMVVEATYEGFHTLAVQAGLRLGMFFFICSEVMFFAAFFWAYFHASLAPTIEIGSVWPPVGITVFSAWEIPFLNTLILLLSGATVTWAHYAVVNGIRSEAIYGLFATVVLGFIFTLVQGYEYVHAPFTIADGIYGSIFYMATGFHGFHVLIGTVFLLVCLVRQIDYHFSTSHHFGLEAAAWYWHFVDVVWLFLFTSVYWWGGV